MIYTTEQLQIIYNEEKELFVEARAGTGKTTVLEGIARENFHLSILLLVFNKDIRKAAKIIMPINVESHTINSFAFKYYKNGALTKKQAGDKFLLKDNLSSFSILTTYLRHLPQDHNTLYLADKISKSFNNLMDFNIKEIDKEIDEIVQKIIFDMDKNRTPLTHNFILRDFLNNFDFTKFNYEHIIIDEAQDLNGVMLEIIKKIKNIKTTYVGDPLQSIYGFRGNIDIFNTAKDPLSLTGSFRMGKVLGDFIQKSTSIANNKKILFEGLNKEKGELIGETKNIIEVNNYEKLVIISRTNANLFEQAFKYAKEGKNIAIPFEWEKIKSLIESVYYLRMGLLNSITSEHIKLYKTFDIFEKSIKRGTDIEFKFLLKLIKKEGITLLDNLYLLEKHLSSNKYADIICITAHKSKGLEFENVKISNDFMKYCPQTKQEERNLVYVAITRASKKLYLNEDLTNILRRISK